MGLWKSLLGLERRFAWGVLGFVSGTLLGIAGLYFALHERRPNLTVEVTSQFDILDVRQPLQDLSILFQGTDIQKSNQNLRTLHVQFSNDGEADLLQSQYDQSESWGLQLRGGRILKVQLLDASNAYIRSHLAPKLLSDSTVLLNKLILERGRHFTLDLLILHPKNRQPLLAVTGKVVGLDSIPVRVNASAGRQPSIWLRALGGSAWTQSIRLLVYFLAGLVLLITLLIAGSSVSDLLGKHARRRRAKEIRLVLETTSPEEVLARDILEHLYSVSGGEALIRARKMLHDKAFFSDGVWPGAAEEAWRIRSAAMHAEQGVDAEPPDHFGMVHEQHRQMEDMLFADDLRDRLRKARLVVRDAGVERIHAAFEKLLGIAIQRLVEPEPEHEEEKDRTA